MQEHRMQAKERLWLLAACVALSALFVTLMSTTSPLYLFHDSTDANWFFTMGKGMVNGKVLYRDLFDHKGPLLYALHAVGYLLSPTDFHGVWMIQIVFFAAFLYVSYYILRLYLSQAASYCGLIFTAAAAASAKAYAGGDTAEELCLPLLAVGVYVTLRHFARTDGKPVAARVLLGCGVLAGCVLWIKYTMLGIYFIMMAALFFERLLRRDWRRAFTSCAWFLLGMLLATLPWVVYFAVNGALGSWWEVYFYDNLFRYPADRSVVTLFGQEFHGKRAFFLSFLQPILEQVSSNIRTAWFLISGTLLFVCTRCAEKSKAARGVFFAEAALLVLLQLGAKPGAWDYYFMVMYVLLPVCFAAYARALAWLCGKCQCKSTSALCKRPWPVGVSAAAAACTLVLCGAYAMRYGARVDRLAYTREDYPALVFSDTLLAENADTLLLYRAPDLGCYTATGIVPECRFYANSNFPRAAYPALYDTQDDFVLNRRVEYVVTFDFVYAEEQNDTLAAYTPVQASGMFLLLKTPAFAP